MDPAEHGAQDPSDLFVHCPRCGRVAQPDSMSYTLLGGTENTVDETRPVDVRCQICHQPSDGRGHWAPATTMIICRRCGEQSPTAAEAVRTRCVGCGLFNFGPAAATPADRRRLVTAERFEQQRMLHRAMPWRFADPHRPLPRPRRAAGCRRVSAPGRRGRR